jgi:3-oxoacyl-[acyl-carrier protein] reductase
MDLGLRDRTALVGGGSSGLGLGAARALAAEGVRVAIGARDPEKLERARAELGYYAIAIEADLSTVEGAIRFARAGQAALGQVDILVPNAGGPPPGNFASTDLAAYPGALDLSLLSTIALCKELVPGMQERGWGRVVAITSIAVREPMAFLILSNTARAGLTGFLKTLAREVAPDGVTVNSVLPGVHDTPRVRAVGGDSSERLEAMAQRIPAGRIGDADEFGHVVAFLCSQHAAFVTGTALAVDGGQDQHLL